MPKINWSIVIASVIAGVVVLLLDKYAFRNEIVDNQVQSKLFFQD